MATAEFAAEGFHGARVDRIAGRMRASKRMIYYYFGSKDGLYVAVLAAAYERMREAGLAAGADSTAPLQALGEYVRATFDYLSANPNFVRLIVGENIRRAEGLQNVQGIERLGDRMLGPLGGICARGLASGEFRPGLVALDLLMSISALCLFQVANRHTFAALHGADMTSAAALRARREHVVAMVLEFASADRAAADPRQAGLDAALGQAAQALERRSPRASVRMRGEPGSKPCSAPGRGPARQGESRPVDPDRFRLSGETR